MENCNMKNNSNIQCSIVVPLYNETRIVDELYSRLTKVMEQTNLIYELLFIDDGSSDNTLEKLKFQLFQQRFEPNLQLFQLIFPKLKQVQIPSYYEN